MDQVAGGLPWSRLRRIAEHVQTNLAAELRLTELSAVVHMSPYHFARLFKQATGVSPRQFVIRRRIEAAKILLAARRPIREVALAVGFCSQSHFTTSFRRLTGLTPGHYRSAASKHDHEHSSWGNNAPLVQPADVAAARRESSPVQAKTSTR
jgi:AraC family transcriptional regulator